MFFFNTNKFKQPTENRFGRKPPNEKLSFDTENAPSLQYLATTSIWESLGISEMEYYEKFHKSSPPENAIKLQTQQETSADITTAGIDT